MSVAVFDHPVLSGLLGDEEFARLWGWEAELAAMLAFEAGLATAEAQRGVIPEPAAAAIRAAIARFDPDVPALKAAAGRDGVAAPELVRQLRAHIGEPHGRHLHFGATSQDVADTALVLRLRPVLAMLAGRGERLGHGLAELSRRFGERRLMGRTRMQAALPIRVADRVESWRGPLRRSLVRLGSLQGELAVVQFGGAVGTLESLGEQGPAVRAALAAELGLADAPQWHSQRDRIAELGAWLAELTGSLGKFGQDVALMAQAGDEIVLSGGGASSAMAHKQNPVAAETLVALARFNAAQLGALHQALVHEQERSGAAWTLEWLTLPPMLAAAACATGTALRLLGQMDGLGLSTPA